AAFRALFAKSPVKRIGRDRFVRNVLIAIGNSGEAALAVEAERLLDDESALVRGAAVWALSQLLPREAFAALAPKAIDEADATVRAEWEASHPHPEEHPTGPREARPDDKLRGVSKDAGPSVASWFETRVPRSSP